MNEIDDFFLKQMRGVSPIIKKNKIKKEEPKTEINTIKKIKKTKNQKTIVKTTTPPQKSLFKLESVNIKNNIKKGLLRIDKKIDFHGSTLSESEERFSKSIIKCYNDGTRCLLFVTGKGLYMPKEENKESKPKLYHGVIRSALIDWVKAKKFSKYILSYEGALPQHGGAGAFYVYLRKKKN